MSRVRLTLCGAKLCQRAVSAANCTLERRAEQPELSSVSEVGQSDSCLPCGADLDAFAFKGEGAIAKHCRDIIYRLAQ